MTNRDRTKGSSEPSDCKIPEDLSGDGPSDLRGALERVRADSERSALRKTALRQAQACARFAPPGQVALMSAPGEDPFARPGAHERVGLVRPVHEEFDQENAGFCTWWIEECWIPLADTLRKLELAEVVAEWKPSPAFLLESEADEKRREMLGLQLMKMHGFFCRIVRGEEPAIVAADLANLRRSSEPRQGDLEVAKGEPRLIVEGLRFMLGKYFEWVAAQLHKAFDPRSAVTPAGEPNDAHDGAVPRTMEEAANWLMAMSNFLKYLSLSGFSGLPDLKRGAPDPVVESTGGRWPLYRLGDLVEHTRRKVKALRDVDLPFNDELRRHLKPPRSEG